MRADQDSARCLTPSNTLFGLACPATCVGLHWLTYRCDPRPSHPTFLALPWPPPAQTPSDPAQYGTHATEPKSSPELGRYLERVKSGRGVYLFVDLRYLYDQPDWAKLCGPAWNGLAATPPSLPPWAKLVLEEELAGFKYIFCSHMWFTSWPVWERSPMRDFWCVSAAQRYFGEGDPKSVGSWVASEEPIWLWCDKVTNPQADPTNSVFADLFRWTTTKFAALATEAHTFALYHGYKLLSWTECADKVLIIVDALASRVFADNADSWKKHANRFTLFARVMNSLPGPGLILPSGAYAERAWCQVEVAARRASTGSGILGEGFCIPLLQHGAQCQHPTVPDDVGTYLSLYDWAHVVSEQFSAVLGVDVEQIWQARHMDGSVATRAMRDLMRREMPNHEATGTTTSILLCSSISVFDDIHAILPRHVLNIYLRTGRVIPERCDSESILHTVQAFTKAAVGSSGEQWDEAAVKGALHLACASAIDLSSMRWGVYKRLRVPVEFVGALMGILVHFNDNVKDGLRTALQPYDSCESIGEYMESVCQAYGIASPAQVFTKASESSATGKAGLRRPCTDLQTWSKLDRSEVLFTDETGTPIFAKAGPDLYSVPLCPPEMFIGTAVVTEQLWAGGHTMDWGNLQLRVVPAKLPASASMAERLDSRGLVSFAGLLDNIRTDADYMKDGYIPAGCTGGNFERW